MRIFTGALVPKGADRVVMQEDCVREGDFVIARLPKRDGRNIRSRSEDLQ